MIPTTTHSNRFDRHPIKHLFLGILILVGTLLPACPVPVHAGPLHVVEGNDAVIRNNNGHPPARNEFDWGEADASLPTERMIPSLPLPSAQSPWGLAASVGGLVLTIALRRKYGNQ